MSWTSDYNAFRKLMADIGVSRGDAIALLAHAHTIQQVATWECGDESKYRMIEIERSRCPSKACNEHFREAHDGVSAKDFKAPTEPPTEGDVDERPQLCRDCRAIAAVREICKKYNIAPKIGGDPRGFCLKLVIPEADGTFKRDGHGVLLSRFHNTWGGAEEGYGVPTREM